MKPNKKPVFIVIAEDDPDDRLLIEEALNESALTNPYCFVEDGIELLKVLRENRQDSTTGGAHASCLVLLDLNMPRMDGREALREIKNDPALRRIPVVVLTTSKADEDIIKSYDLGVSGFISKPVEFSDLINIIKALKRYWLEIVELPN